MSLFRLHAARWLLPGIAVAYLAAWWWLARSVVDTVPLRSDTFVTNPYAVLIAVGFATAIGIARVTPPTSLVLVSLLLVAQMLFWPARFSQLSWVGYIGLAVVVAAVFVWGSPPVRWVALGASCLWSVSVSVLLTVPAFSLSGVWGTVNGKPAGSAEVPAGFAIWSVVGLLATGYLWYLTRRFRRADASSLTMSPKAALDGAGAPENDRAALQQLSPRELEIFALVARGLSNAEIARDAHIEESTVKTHLSSILAKLRLSTRVQLVVLAYEHGLSVPAGADS